MRVSCGANVREDARVTSQHRVLVTAFATVPGTSPHGAALMDMAAAVPAEIDFITVKTEALSHVERMATGRMFRVPVGDGDQQEQREAYDRAVARQLDADRYDIVHVRGPFEGALAAERKAELGYQLVYELATFPDEALGVQVEKMWGHLHERTVEAADLVIVPTEAAQRGLTETFPNARVEVLAPGVDVGDLDWSSQPSNRVPRLLYLGHFTADRDLPTVLAAVRRVRERYPVEVLLAGETDVSRRDRVRHLVRAFGLEECVQVRGEPQPSLVPGIIARADICLAPAAAVPRFQSLGDLPQPLLEYLACRRPVVAAAVPGAAEVMRDELEGLVYPPGDDEALAGALLQLLGSVSMSTKLAEAGYRRVRDSFSNGARRRRISSIYAGLLPSLYADPWRAEFPSDDGDIGPTESEIEAAEAALRADPDESRVRSELNELAEEPTTISFDPPSQRPSSRPIPPPPPPRPRPQSTTTDTDPGIIEGSTTDAWLVDETTNPR